MSIATSEKIHSPLERLTASLRAARETIRPPLLENGAAILDALKAMQHALQEGLREGLERDALLGTLAAVRPQAERGAQWLRQILAIFEGDAVAAPPLAAQLREAEGFLTWLGDLKARVVAGPPFEESRLSPAPDGPTAEGYLSASEARTRVRTKP